ncbi:MAG TPA: metallopeptidase family protein [Tepidisphaeraceae bacterium]
MAIKVSKREFEGLVEEAIAELPEPFAEFLEEVPIEVHTRPSLKLLRELGMADDELLMGLYRGVDRTRRSVEDSGRLPDVIYIFQEDHELVCNSRRELLAEVRKTVLHEIGHHFGLSEEDLDRLGYG